MALRDYKALAFDVYGTLIDWESGIINALSPLTCRAEISLERDEILELHAWHESTGQRFTPARRYSELLATVYRRLAEQWGVAVGWDECQVYGASVGQWPAFDDSRDALHYLARHYQLVVLTNTDNASFSGSRARLDTDFRGIYTAEDIGSYKPADRNFEYLIEMLNRQGIEKHEILHTAESLFHDHVPARKHGLANCWIHRRHASQGFGATMDPGEMPSVDYRFTSMAELVDAHRAEGENR